MKKQSFFEVLTEAINYFANNGYGSQKALDDWVKKLSESAVGSFKSQLETEKEIKQALKSAYSRLVTQGGLVKEGVSRYTIEKLKPSLRMQLQRQILASANLIKFNRSEALSTTLRRFQGWATAQPKGGSRAVNVKKEKESIRKPLARLDFIERRVAIDQTHKLIANINEIVAVDGGAIAATWHSKWKQINYDYREDHKERDKCIYAIRDSWAMQKGFMKAGNDGYTDEITQPGEEVYCRCHYGYIYTLKKLPKAMLTKKGQEALALNNK